MKKLEAFNAAPDWSVYRFHDQVAAHLGNGKTVYLTADEASTIARALKKVVRSIDRESFADSNVGTISGSFYRKQ